MGVVRYLDYKHDTYPEDTPGLQLLHRVMHKRKAFAHEQEARIVKWEPKYFHVASHEAIQDIPHVIELPWDAESVVEGVYVNPYAKQWYFETVKTALQRFAPKLVSRTMWSDIRVDSV
jgi:hypothetical protein